MLCLKRVLWFAYYAEVCVLKTACGVIISCHNDYSALWVLSGFVIVTDAVSLVVRLVGGGGGVSMYLLSYNNLFRFVTGNQ